MKNSLKITSLLVVAMLAFAGCAEATTPTTTTTTDSTTTTTTETQTDTTDSTMKATTTTKVGTPSGVENMNEVEAGGNRVVTYSTAADADAAFEAQSKLVMAGGWADSYQGMNAPVKAMGTVTQTFSANGKIMVVAVTPDPMNQGKTLVTMTESADPMAQ